MKPVLFLAQDPGGLRRDNEGTPGHAGRLLSAHYCQARLQGPLSLGTLRQRPFVEKRIQGDLGIHNHAIPIKPAPLNHHCLVEQPVPKRGR